MEKEISTMIAQSWRFTNQVPCNPGAAGLGCQCREDPVVPSVESSAVGKQWSVWSAPNLRSVVGCIWPASAIPGRRRVVAGQEDGDESKGVDNWYAASKRWWEALPHPQHIIRRLLGLLSRLHCLGAGGAVPRTEASSCHYRPPPAHKY